MYCVKIGKYGVEIHSCKGGITWDEAVTKLITINKANKT